MKLDLTDEQQAEIERDLQTVREINRHNAVLVALRGAWFKLGVLSVFVLAAGAPKRWGALDFLPF